MNMKNLLFAFLLFPLFSFAQTATRLWSVHPEKPRPGESFTIVYDWQNGPLANEDALEIVVVECDGEKATALEVMPVRKNGRVEATLKTSSAALTLGFGAHSGQHWDNQFGQGYFVDLHGTDGQPLAESKAARAILYNNFGYALDINTKPAVTHGWLEESFKAAPALRQKYMVLYMNNLARMKRGEAGKKESQALAEQLLTAPDVTEKQLLSVVRMFERRNMAERAATVKEQVRAKYPKGQLVRQERRVQIEAQSDMGLVQQMIATYEKDFPAQSDQERRELRDLYSQLAEHCLQRKEWSQARAMTEKSQDPVSTAQMYNSVAWEQAESGGDLAEAKRLAWEAVSLARQECAVPGNKPAEISRGIWAQINRDNYSSYLDTYAFVLDKMGDNANAADYAARAVALGDGKNPEVNERYCNLLERIKSPELRRTLEGFIMKGKATSTMKKQLKEVYKAEDTSEKGFDTYMNRLTESAKAHLRQELVTSMLDQPAPDFTLRDLDGKTVSLESLKGKVVIVDFWATWCGPCKASFPGMQMAVNQHKDQADVAFLFVDTWENAADKQKNAADFIRSKEYTFQVLLDTEDKVVSDFGVSGIPTKFILDKKGRICFKNVGYEGSAEGLAEELSTMIELAKTR